jgi:type IV secretion system protein TrbL
MKNKIIPFAIVIIFYSMNSSADLAYNGANGGVIDQVISAFQNKASAWGGAIMTAASWLFWTLSTISLAWSMGQLALKKADIGDFYVEFIRFAVVFGFFYWLLSNAIEFAGAIMTSLRQLAENASGTGKLSPSDLVDKGFMIFKMALKQTSVWEPVDSFIGVVLSVAILLLLTAIAVNMMLLLVSQWVLMYAGIFFLGMGGSSWTSDMAINYYKTVLGIAVQLFTMVLIAGVGIDLITGFYNQMNVGEPSFEEMGVMLVTSFALWMLTSSLPSLVAGIITGTNAGNAVSSLGAGSIASAAMAGAAMAGAAIAAGGSAMLSGAANTAGVADALNAASTIPEGDNFTSNGGPIRSGDNASNGAGTTLDQVMGDNNTGSQANNSNSQGTNRVSNATSRLTQGIRDVAQTKAANMKAQFQELVSQTVPGQVSEAIKSNDAAYNSGIDTDNSLSAGTDQATDPESEIASFVNKGA